MQEDSLMLVLSRKKNESIMINDEVTVYVVEIRGDKVRLGIEHPPEMSVHRNEVYEAIRRNMDEGKTAEEAAAERIRQRIAGLRRQIENLEAQL
jgi:carbon storage regulator